MRQLRIRFTLKGKSTQEVGDWDDLSNYTVDELQRMQKILNNCCSEWQLEWR